MLPPLRIALLECDELVGETKREYGSIGDVYKKFLEAGALKLEASGLYERPNLDISSYDVVNKQEYPDAENIDAVFLTGSRLNNWILKLVDFIKEMLQNQSRVRIMAVCFGHQIVGRAYGVMPERNDSGWEVSVTPMVLTKRGKQVFGQDSLALHQMHRDILARHPPSVEKLGHSDCCDVQGIYVKNRVITLQGHPEYNAKIASEFLDRRRGSVLDDTTYQDGKNRYYEVELRCEDSDSDSASFTAASSGKHPNESDASGRRPPRKTKVIEETSTYDNVLVVTTNEHLSDETLGHGQLTPGNKLQPKRWLTKKPCPEHTLPWNIWRLEPDLHPGNMTSSS